MYTIRPPFLLKWIFRKAIFSLPTNKKKIYLTFDDGPTPEVTTEVISLLKRYNAKATFFCVGRNVKDNPEILELIRKEGHSVGNHTYSHKNGWRVSTRSYMADVSRCKALISSKLFRPPHGRMSIFQYLKLKRYYKIIMWDVLSGDFDEKATPEKCLSNVIKYTRPGSIVVFHDSIKTKDKLLQFLPEVLKHFTERGYRFSALEV